MWLAAEKRLSSPWGRPISWIPTGRPVSERPQGIVMSGRVVVLTAAAIVSQR